MGSPSHGQTDGWDSVTGRFMVSSDQRTWDTRSTRRLIAFAVDPGDRDHIVAADGAEGFHRLHRRREDWEPRHGPALVALSWDQTAGLFGADDDGNVHRSTDGGATWAPAGRLPGSPQAFLASGDALYAAVDVDGTTAIYRSTDTGGTWGLRYGMAPDRRPSSVSRPSTRVPRDVRDASAMRGR